MDALATVLEGDAAARAAGGAEAVLAAARLHRDGDAEAQTLHRADDGLRALLRAIVLGEAGRAVEALSLTGRILRFYHHDAVCDLVRALEAMAPEVPDGTVYRDASGRPVTFVVSYPRSGSTRFLAIMDGAFEGSRHAVFLRDGRYFSLRSPVIDAPGPVFVKDHTLRRQYANNPVLYLVRDGRDVYLSQHDFILRQHHAAGKAMPLDGADSLRHLLETVVPAHGSWQHHVLHTANMKARGQPVTILRYEDFAAGDGYGAVAAATDALGLPLDRARYEAGLAEAARNEAFVRGARPEWSRAPLYPADSMMARSVADPAPGRWRHLLTAEEKKRLHRSGLTPGLIAMGYESERDWWQSAT